MSEMEPLVINVALVGDEACGKTALGQAFLERQTDEDSLHDSGDFCAVTQCLSAVVLHNEQEYTVSILDTQGSDEWAAARREALGKATAVLLCFSVISRTSLASITEKWQREIMEYAPHSRVIVVGTKTDLRDDVDICDRLQRRGETVITPLEGQQAAKSAGGYAYVECSAGTLDGVPDVLTALVELVGGKSKKKRKKPCTLL